MRRVNDPLASPVAAPRQLEPMTVRPSSTSSRTDVRLSLPGSAGVSRTVVDSPEGGSTMRRRMTTFAGNVLSPTQRALAGASQQQRKSLYALAGRKGTATASGNRRRSVVGPQRRESSSPSRRQTLSQHGSIMGERSGEGRGMGDGFDGEKEVDSEDSGEDDEEEDDGHDSEAMNQYDSRLADRMYRETQAGAIYEDGGRLYRGTIDRRGITPYVTFTTTEVPPSQRNNPLLLAGAQRPCCGFCGASNLIWVLRCCFCGCTRMSDAPRLKYLIDMVLSHEPRIKPVELVKRIMDFAKFDHVAMKVEQKFKQASMVRARAAIMMMSRTIGLLRTQMIRMIFVAWRGNNAVQSRQDAVMQRLIKIKDIQVKSRHKELAFVMWKGYVDRVIEERTQRLSLAARQNEITRLRRTWGLWQKFMRINGKEKLAQLKAHYEAERNEAPNAFLMEIDRLKENLKESRRLVFTATNTMLELLQQSVQSADQEALRLSQLQRMYPTTVEPFLTAVNGQKIVDGLMDGHIAMSDDSNDPTTTMEGASGVSWMQTRLDETKDHIERMAPFESLIEWLNCQRRRGVEVMQTAPAAPTMSSAASSPALATNTNGASPSTVPPRASVKIRTKEKKKEFKPIKGLQDLRANISSPGVMLKLLCHTSQEARLEYDRVRATEGGVGAGSSTAMASAIAENSTTATILSPSALVQLRVYFKIIARVLPLPPDVISRDAFVLGDFDSLYAYTVYLYVFHPNYVSPGTLLPTTQRLGYSFLASQWSKIQHMLIEDEFDPFAQQQFYIFLAKVKRTHKQFQRFNHLCKAVDQIATWHQQAVLRDTLNDFSRRVLGKDSNVSVALEKETLAAWVALPAAKLLGLCENEDELREIERVFKDNVLELVKLFRIYGSGSGGKGILEQEFLKVMTRTGVTDKKNILRSHLQLIYHQARQSSPAPTPITNSSSSPMTGSLGSPAVSGNGSDGEDEGGIEDRGATPNEFFEAIVRVAHHNYMKRRELSTTSLVPIASLDTSTTNNGGSNDDDSKASGPNTDIGGSIGNSATLLAHVQELVVEKVVPLTRKFQEQGLMFKKQMLHPDVQTVCKAQEKKLKRIFLSYSQKNKNPGARGKLMDLSDFETLLKERRLVDALFPHGKIKQLVAFVQQDGDLSAMGVNGFESDSEFVFSEFLEALAAIAVYRNANPYLPLAKKLETFFDESF